MFFARFDSPAFLLLAGPGLASTEPLDWRIVALDAVGLLLFLVPGVIAFAVDFNNGTIYLPPDYRALKSSNRSEMQLVTVSVPEEKLTVRKLEEMISRHTKRDIRLIHGAYQTEKLENIDEFWATTDKLTALSKSPPLAELRAAGNDDPDPSGRKPRSANR